MYQFPLYGLSGKTRMLTLVSVYSRYCESFLMRIHLPAYFIMNERRSLTSFALAMIEDVGEIRPVKVPVNGTGGMVARCR